MKVFSDLLKAIVSKHHESPQHIRLHYKATVLYFLIATILVTSRQYIGEHIRCIADKGVPEHVMNTFCFFTSTFTVIKDLDANLLDTGNVAHPGVGAYGINSPEPIKRHAYYQWVPFVLFFQAIMFYMTHLLWKKLEGGRLRYLVEGLKFAAFSLNDKELPIDSKRNIPNKANRDEKIHQIRNLFLQGIYINKNWSRKLIICEVLNFLHVILQIYITDHFLNGHFTSLGTHLIQDGLESNVDILDEVFPKITKCTFHKYGPSGSIQYHDAMCVMALNIINDKIYTGLWFWFVFLLLFSMLGLIWRITTIIFHARSKCFNRFVFSNSCPGRLNPWKTLSVSNHGNYTDWLFLGIAEDMEKKTSKGKLLDDVDGDSLS
ncbi:hypothetical protein JTB14_006653 [Gonioctena quinquepunctata]|nr:hypothetical protein JTB14_006653 [Gonioctena quinquepunctata]